MHPTSLADVQQLLARRLSALGRETIDLTDARGRVLAECVTSPTDIPLFSRSAMDGFAVRAADVATASDENPATLAVVGKSLPNRPYVGSIHGGQAVAITTGAPLPEALDTVVKQEDVEITLDGIRIASAVDAGKNVGRRGEDVRQGEAILSAGRCLRPQDLGVLASLGITQVSVARQPRAALFVTGNEVLPLGSRPVGFQIVDSSSIMLRALVHRDGALIEPAEYLTDDPRAIRVALLACQADVLIVTGGTSVGPEDFAPAVVEEIGELCVHGVDIRPAKPIGVGFIGGRLVFLLPGNPLSCLCAYDLVVCGALQRLGGRPLSSPYRQTQMVLAADIPSCIGRVDYVRVIVRNGAAIPFKHGSGTGASILSSASRSDGFVIVPAEVEKLVAGDVIDVYLYDAASAPVS